MTSHTGERLSQLRDLLPLLDMPDAEWSDERRPTVYDSRIVRGALVVTLTPMVATFVTELVKQADKPAIEMGLKYLIATAGRLALIDGRVTVEPEDVDLVWMIDDEVDKDDLLRVIDQVYRSIHSYVPHDELVFTDAPATEWRWVVESMDAESN